MPKPRNRRWLILVLVLGTPVDHVGAQDASLIVGAAGDGRVIVPTNQVLTPAGRQVPFPGRPTDLALLPDGRTVAVKNLRDLILLDAESGTILQTLRLPGGGHAVAGLAVADGGSTIYSSTVGGKIEIAVRDGATGRWAWSTSWTLPAPLVGGDPAPTGLALAPDGRTLLALSGRGNTLCRIDRATGASTGQPIAVGVAPFGVVVAPNGKPYVSNWGGDPPDEDHPREDSSGTPVAIDPKTGASASGSVSVVDLEAGVSVRSIATGLHPSGLALSPEGRFLYVACANSDTVAVIDTTRDELVESIAVSPEARLPFGSGPNALAVSPDGTRLYVANGTNNALAVVELGDAARDSKAGSAKPSRTLGFLPTGWYPGAVLVRPDAGQLVVANIKGHGSLRPPGGRAGLNSRDYLGTVSLIPIPTDDELAKATRLVAENNRQALAISGLEPPRPDTLPVPVPERHGEPSVLKHVLYIIKENRTYDQVFGDIERGDGDPSLCLFGREVTPNQHALADEFILLDNFYCAGVLSADGHAWATEAYATDYLERHFGGFNRSYPYDGDDPLAYAPGGFLWDNALAHGKTFRDYGEFVKARITPKAATWADLYADYRDGTSLVKVEARPAVGTLKGHLCPTFVGFPGTVPDVYRAGEFLKEFRRFERAGGLPDLIVMLLPNDHTVGTRPGYPTPKAAVADNDLALGQVVEAVSHSRFWPETAIFVVEDDPQAGFDHVDGHRTIAQVISPYTRRGAVDHAFLSQLGMVKTIELILGLPPMNQMDLAAPAMRSCFRLEPDLKPFEVRPNEVPLNEMNPDLAELSGPRLQRAQLSLELDLDEVDEADEDTFNRLLWHAVKGDDAPYPELSRREPDED